ncbi:hypothetical protein [Shewanella baltica]|uniref:hypothetical protein n=1 Tax=Shewanella baltica TaxID=62322 RepID=UPI001ED91CB4|nr:hypothetical protein [Shewanella baltica]
MQIACKCGETHAVLLKDFDLEGTEVKPKRLVRLKCVYHYEQLEDILEAETELKIDAELKNPVQNFIGKLLIKFFTWKFNRKTGA